MQLGNDAFMLQLNETDSYNDSHIHRIKMIKNVKTLLYLEKI